MSELKDRLEGLKSELEDGEAALEAESKGCAFLESQKNQVQQVYDLEAQKNENRIKDKATALKGLLVELQQLKKEKSVLV